MRKFLALRVPEGPLARVARRQQGHAGGGDDGVSSLERQNMHCSVLSGAASRPASYPQSSARCRRRLPHTITEKKAPLAWPAVSGAAPDPLRLPMRNLSSILEGQQ